MFFQFVFDIYAVFTFCTLTWWTYYFSPIDPVSSDSSLSQSLIYQIITLLESWEFDHLILFRSICYCYSVALYWFNKLHTILKIVTIDNEDDFVLKWGNKSIKGIHSDWFSFEIGWSERLNVNGRKLMLQKLFWPITISDNFWFPEISQFKAYKNKTFSETQLRVKLKSR